MSQTHKTKPADQEAVAARAKKHFMEDFQGAKINLPTSFFHPPVVRAFKRTFYPATRNWWLTTQLASKLKDEALRVRVQEAMLAKVVETLNKIKKQEQQLEALMVSAELQQDMIARGKPYTETVTLYGPVSAKFREVMLGCDRLMDRATLLYTMGEMPQSNFEDVGRDVKNFLKGIDTSLRNYRIQVMTKLNAEGGARPNFQGKKPEAADVQAPAQGGAGGDPETQALAAAEAAAEAMPEPQAAQG